MAGLPPSTSEEIATATGLNERYVREWLNAMTVGRVILYDPAARTYALPAEHAACLTRAAGPDNLAHLAQFTSLMGNVEDSIVDCFRHGGGVPYSSFPAFQALMAEMSAQVHDVALISGELALVDGLLDRLASGIDVGDVGCGSGHAINLMAKEYLGLTNVTFEVKDVATIDGSQQFDLVTAFDAIHDQAQPARVLQGIADSLRDDGVFFCVDINASSHVEENLDHPLGAVLYSVSTFHCMTVSLALDGAGLGTVWGEQTATRMFHEAGFTDVETKNIPEDIFNVYYIARKG